LLAPSFFLPYWFFRRLPDYTCADPFPSWAGKGWLDPLLSLPLCWCKAVGRACLKAFRPKSSHLFPSFFPPFSSLSPMSGHSRKVSKVILAGDYEAAVTVALFSLPSFLPPARGRLSRISSLQSKTRRGVLSSSLLLFLVEMSSGQRAPSFLFLFFSLLQAVLVWSSDEKGQADSFGTTSFPLPQVHIRFHPPSPKTITRRLIRATKGFPFISNIRLVRGNNVRALPFSPFFFSFRWRFDVSEERNTKKTCSPPHFLLRPRGLATLFFA